MIADPLTKGLLPKMFNEHTTHIHVISFEDIYGNFEGFSIEIKFYLFIYTFILEWFDLNIV